jgi:single-strand DNA-binding protein
MSVNRVVLLGRLGQDPEIKYTPSGMAVCNFSLATTESWQDKSGGGKQERTEWHRIVVWGKLAELCNQYLAKGRQAFVEGRLQTRSWDAKEGGKRYTTEVVASNIQFLGGASAGAGTSERATNSTDSGAAGTNFMNQDYDIPADSNFTADDIPF